MAGHGPHRWKAVVYPFQAHCHRLVRKFKFRPEISMSDVRIRMTMLVLKALEIR